MEQSFTLSFASHQNHASSALRCSRSSLPRHWTPSLSDRLSRQCLRSRRFRFGYNLDPRPLEYSLPRHHTSLYCMGCYGMVRFSRRCRLVALYEISNSALDYPKVAPLRTNPYLLESVGGRVVNSFRFGGGTNGWTTRTRERGCRRIREDVLCRESLRTGRIQSVEGSTGRSRRRGRRSFTIFIFVGSRSNQCSGATCETDGTTHWRHREGSTFEAGP